MIKKTTTTKLQKLGGTGFLFTIFIFLLIKTCKKRDEAAEPIRKYFIISMTQGKIRMKKRHRLKKKIF